MEKHKKKLYFVRLSKENNKDEDTNRTSEMDKDRDAI